MFGLEPPKLMSNESMDGYEWAETEMITMARNEGLEARTVRGFRDSAVQLAREAALFGKPVSDAVLDGELAKHRSLTLAQRASFRKLYRELEGSAQ